MELPYSNLQTRIWNPGATMPLILPIRVICNTPDDVLHENIRINSRRPGKWLFAQPAHSRPAILCGSGPSLKHSLDEVRSLVRDGGMLIALNGAAAYLDNHGMLPDYQVILDAQQRTAELVGPARHHLFASQAHPDCWERAPDAQMWHLQVEGIDALLPDDPPYDDDYTLIGAASSVGVTALVVAYALGCRTLHCFGYDSSNKGEASHAFRQPMNDGEPMVCVTFNGKKYLCSLTMKLQAERFPETARLLEREGCKVFVHGEGLLPDVWNAPVEVLSEREKYERLWTIPEYRQLAPGEHCVDAFLAAAKPAEGARVLDYGSGTGRAALLLHLAGLQVTMIDFAHNCRDVGAAHLPFLQHDLTEPLSLRGEYGFCTDVMEHIPPDDVRRVLAHLFEATPAVFFAIDTKPDLCGAMINQQLHLTLMPHEEWRTLLSEFGTVVHDDAGGDHSTFYVVKE